MEILTRKHNIYVSEKLAKDCIQAIEDTLAEDAKAVNLRTVLRTNVVA